MKTSFHLFCKTEQLFGRTSLTQSIVKERKSMSPSPYLDEFLQVVQEDDAPAIEFALAYARSRFAVFPVFGITEAGRCQCGSSQCKSAGKHPRLANGFKNATQDEGQIRAWWEMWPDSNIGIATGAVSGIFVVDIDAKNDGVASLQALEAEMGPWPKTLKVLTGSGGGSSHLYFQLPVGKSIRNSTSVLAPGIDVRGDGGYVVAPPSRHVSGARYRFVIDTQNQ
jgi:hypothetical protein